MSHALSPSSPSLLSRLSRQFIPQVIVGILLGALLGYFDPRVPAGYIYQGAGEGIINGILDIFRSSTAAHMGYLGGMYIKALQAIAPLMVLVLVMSSMMHPRQKQGGRGIRTIVILYLCSTVLGGVLAVLASHFFPSELKLQQMGDAAVSLQGPGSLSDVLDGLVSKILENPAKALVEGNFIGVLVWGLGLGLALRSASDTTQKVVQDLSNACTRLIRLVIRCSPIGVFGLVANNVSTVGISAFAQYLHVLAVLIGCMVFIALVINPIIVLFIIRRNPWPLVFMCLKESGITAFFTRSSAANIPVNLAVCERLKLDKNIYQMSIPIGANISMSGAVTTITVLTLAAVHTLHIDVSMGSALVLCIIATIAALGASGIAGGSVILIPMACSLFGIDPQIAGLVVAFGMTIGVVQDSTETALNSSTDLLFTVAVCQAEERKALQAQNQYAGNTRETVSVSHPAE
ncbi:serine/threonine transporter SstT [Zymobacter palmae]|uniref:Na+/serine symporter n=1 Tax=Zymobacter palmae TaxID=33074 RepID=A0A348HB56_9GAMM|nr:serine/threonine transporter SstT [Zymobacter palmae]BBG28858.1 Na+/serine symporter [Zymobacter palmae]